MHCSSCGSKSITSKGSAPTSVDSSRRRYRCKSCGFNFYVSNTVTIESEETNLPSGLVSCFTDFNEDPIEDTQDDIEEEYPNEDVIDSEESPTTFVRDDSYVAYIKSKKKIVITSAQNNSEVNSYFFDAIKNYCDINDAALMIIPIKYKKTGSVDQFGYSPEIIPYLIDNRIVFEKYKLSISSDLKLMPTATNPLSGLDIFSKGNSLVFGHPQIQLKTLPRGIDRKYPPIITTTGCITKSNYSSSKIGLQAEFNHNLSAVLVEFDEKNFFIRHLNYDEETDGFYDLDEFYSGQYHTTGCQVDAIVTGDSHVRFHDPEVYKATYCLNGMMENLEPRYWVIHDILDFSSKSPHSVREPFQNSIKHHTNMSCVKTELDEVCNFIINNTPTGCSAIIVGSNHDKHLDKWLKEENDIRSDHVNAEIFHWLSWKKYQYLKLHNKDSIALELFFRAVKKGTSVDVKFLKELDTFKLHDIELAFHGANGLSGSRGSAVQFSKMNDKTVVGHSHAPSINKNCYQVGTSSIFNMGYVKSASAWDHVHCIIHQNGTRQLVFLRDGKYRA